MSDSYAEKVASEPPVTDAIKPEGRSVTLSATLHPNRQVDFQIPRDKIVAGGLLHAIQSQLAMMETMQKLQEMGKAANGGGIVGLLKKMGRG